MSFVLLKLNILTNKWRGVVKNRIIIERFLTVHPSRGSRPLSSQAPLLRLYSSVAKSVGFWFFDIASHPTKVETLQALYTTNSSLINTI